MAGSKLGSWRRSGSTGAKGSKLVSNLASLVSGELAQSRSELEVEAEPIEPNCEPWLNMRFGEYIADVHGVGGEERSTNCSKPLLKDDAEGES